MRLVYSNVATFGAAALLLTLLMIASGALWSSFVPVTLGCWLIVVLAWTIAYKACVRRTTERA